MRHVIFTGFLIAGAGLPALAENADVQWPDCYCTDKTGTRIELGEEICMFVDGRSFTARCEMSLNNPMWRETGDSCLSSHNGVPQSGSPSFDAGLIHT
jgi:hypothetical protein